jgi:hypothetical protein
MTHEKTPHTPSVPEDATGRPVPEKWEIEADAAYARGVNAGLRAWHGDWPPEAVHRVMARNERLLDDVRLARRERRLALSLARGETP